MNFLQLKYFHAVCTYRTVSAAAEFLHISQPSVSSAIKELENEFGVTLFSRQHSGMAMTPEGEQLYLMSEKILSDLAKAERLMQELGNKRKVLRLGVPPMIGSVLLPEIFKSFVTDHPVFSLEITEGGRYELLNKLISDSVDMVFLPHSLTLDKKLSSLAVTQFEIVLCVRKDNPLSKLKSVSPKELADVPLVLFSDGFFQTEEIKKWFAEKNAKPDILLQTQQLSTIISHIESGAAVGFAFRELLGKNPDLCAVQTEPPMKINVSLAWKKESHISESMKQFQQHIKKLYTFKEDNHV